MAIEIERKFLVVNDSFRDKIIETKHIAQGYISRNPDHTVRIRISDDKAFLTIKTRNKGAERGEWEFDIPLQEAEELLSQACLPGVITKNRHIVPGPDDKIWEIDEFSGNLAPLILAEIELPETDTPFDIPEFVGKEVTDDQRYYNSNLSNPATQV